ncbi:hypothetical protein DFH27DRAFT_615453 [Peziza echinospora]|nr:hypothetical protein DFH27DRAFT_615453 [Peziza echinospora]
MPKNRNVHSLCIVLQSSSLPSPAAVSSSFELPYTPLRSSNLGLGNIPQSASGVANSVAPSRSSSRTLAADTINCLNEPSEVLNSKQQGLCLLSRAVAAYSSKSSIFKEGVITPLTPNFSPATRGVQDQKHSQTTTTDLHGTQEAFVSMQSSSNTYSKTGCTNTPNASSDGTPSWHCIDEKLAPQQTHNIARYASLSNLPTPPLSDSSRSPVLFPGACDEDLRSPDLDDVAQYLASVIPKSASATPASIPLIRRMLYLLDLRIEIIALAGIILDSLKPQFVRKWRTELATISLWEDGGNKCEVLALVALGLAIKWIEDSGVSLTASYLSDISGERFCPREINVTERLILQDIGYGLMSFEAEIPSVVREIEGLEPLDEEDMEDFLSLYQG